MVFTRQKSRTGENPESPPRPQPETNLHEVCTPSQTVSAQEHNEIFVQQGVQYSQEKDGEDLHYRVLGLNKSSTEDIMKKTYHKLDIQYHPDKNKHPKASAVMHMINEAKEGLEDLLRYNYTMREQEEDIQYQHDYWREDELIRKAQEETQEQKKQS